MNLFGRHIVEEVPTEQELEQWIELSQKDSKKFFNTCGLKYKALNLKEKIGILTEQEKLKLLSSDGMLIKRPLLVMEDMVLVGFKEKEWEEYLK